MDLHSEKIHKYLKMEVDALGLHKNIYYKVTHLNVLRKTKL
jgi:hypothetical protein